MYPECVVLVNQYSGLPTVFLDEAAARTWLARAGNAQVADSFAEVADKAGYNAYYCDMYE